VAVPKWNFVVLAVLAVQNNANHEDLKDREESPPFSRAIDAPPAHGRLFREYEERSRVPG
jgi:hypothetical protein